MDDEPRGPDVSRHMPYVPVVILWQLVVDLVMRTNSPLGHGHKFGSAQAEAWSLIIPPDDWSAADTDRLVVTVDEP
ncbi:MAG TPA: alpha/beta-hydrolase family protein [Acidimicrobiia bacterium]|nr:alpha/beta-hydrolase family protein [Acidimicrobiia bacterium]